MKIEVTIQIYNSMYLPPQNFLVIDESGLNNHVAASPNSI